MTGMAVVSMHDLPTAEFQKVKSSFFGRSKDKSKGEGICHGTG
jgi:hypothetical protein